MDEHESKQVVDAAQAQFELKIVERLSKTTENLTNRVSAVESKLHTVQTIAGVIATVAVIFGVSGGSGFTILWSAKTALEATEQRVTELSTKLQHLEPIIAQQIDRLQNAAAEQLEQFRLDAKCEAEAVVAGLRSEISSMTSSNELRTRSLRIVNADGRTLVSQCRNDRWPC
jgi:predicted PurR-regulated permease PerM